MEEHIQNIKAIFDEIHKLHHSNHAYYGLVRLCKQILEELNNLAKLAATKDERDNYFSTYQGLSHTLDKEVLFVKYAEDKMNKRNAAKVRTTEYYKAVAEAIDHIELDLISIL